MSKILHGSKPRRWLHLAFNGLPSAGYYLVFAGGLYSSDFLFSSRIMSEGKKSLELFDVIPITLFTNFLFVCGMGAASTLCGVASGTVAVEPHKPRKGPHWTEQIRVSHRLFAIMIAYMLLIYLATFGEILITSFWLRRFPTLGMNAFFLSFFICLTWVTTSGVGGIKLFRRLARRWVAPGDSVSPEDKSTLSLYDRDLDHEFVPAPRSAS